MLTWLPWIYVGSLVVAPIALSTYADRIGRPTRARSVEDAQGPWCAGCGYDVRVMSEPKCPECGADFTKRQSLKFDPRPRKLARYWMTLLIALALAPLWFFGPWIAIPEMASYRVHESWTLPPSDAYRGLRLLSMRQGTLFRWQNTEQYERLRAVRLQVMEPPAGRVPQLVVERDMRWSVRGRFPFPELEGEVFDTDAILTWFAEAGIDVDDPRVRPEADYLHERVRRRLGEGSLAQLPPAPFGDSSVIEGFYWGNRDGAVLTHFGRLCTFPLYWFLAAAIAEVISVRRMPRVRLNPEIEFDIKRGRVVAPAVEAPASR